MNYLYTRQEHYKMFIEKYNTDRLEKGLKIYTTSKSGLLNEMFNQPIETEYEIFNIKNDIKIIFKSKSDSEYRLDIFPIKEIDKGFVNHISFTLSDRSILDEDEYEKPTNKNEMIEILNRIHFIILDIVSKNIVSNYFCIGGTEIKEKNKIYEYFLKIIVGESGFDKLCTIIYKTKWGLYFKV